MMENISGLKGKIRMQDLFRVFGIRKATWYRNNKIDAIPLKQDAAEDKKPGKPKGAALQRVYSPEHRKMVIDKINSDDNADLSVPEIFAKWLDMGLYYGSIRTLYRFLAAQSMTTERRKIRRHGNFKKPELLATAPNQVWSWDITYLKGPARGVFYYLYVILDIFSRYAVGWTVAERQSSYLAQRLVIKTCDRQSMDYRQLIIHSDRHKVMKALSFSQKLNCLGIDFSFSRPHVSNDNPFSESQFKTMKYGPWYPERFYSLQEAISFGQKFFQWYNHEHHHSGIDLLTPFQVHYGEAYEIASTRNKLMEKVYRENPQRFVQRKLKQYSVPEKVWINPPDMSQNEKSICKGTG